MWERAAALQRSASDRLYLIYTFTTPGHCHHQHHRQRSSSVANNRRVSPVYVGGLVEPSLYRASVAAAGSSCGSSISSGGSSGSSRSNVSLLPSNYRSVSVAVSASAVYVSG
jgi:hypothetical protein